jgi:hypothetical protein
MQRSCAVVGTAAVAVAKVPAAIKAARVFVISVSLTVGSPAQTHAARTTAFRRAEPIIQEFGLSDFARSHAFDAVARGGIDSISGVFGTTLRTGCVFAISRLCAGNPTSPQSVPSSVLLNFFMPAPIDGVSTVAMDTAGDEPKLAGGKERPALRVLLDSSFVTL